jgi:hypothetical protein
VSCVEAVASGHTPTEHLPPAKTALTSIEQASHRYAHPTLTRDTKIP